MPFLSLEELRNDPLIAVQTRTKWDEFYRVSLAQLNQGLQVTYTTCIFIELLAKKRPTPSEINYAYLLNRQLLAALPAPTQDSADADREDHALLTRFNTNLRALTTKYPVSWKDFGSDVFNIATLLLIVVIAILGIRQGASKLSLDLLTVVCGIFGVGSGGLIGYSTGRHCIQAPRIRSELRRQQPVELEELALLAPLPIHPDQVIAQPALPIHHNPVHSQSLSLLALAREDDYELKAAETKTDVTIAVEMHQQPQPQPSP